MKGSHNHFLSHLKWKSILAILVAGLLSACKSIEGLRPYAPVETYAEDSRLLNGTPNRALVVTAHDDDMCAMSGTLSLLNRKGWEVAIISFPSTPERNAAQMQACEGILDTVMFFPLSLSQVRPGRDTVRSSYFALPKEKFSTVFNMPLVETELLTAINRFGPSVIFTLDNEMGGYGHPEHVLVSQLVLDLAKARRITPAFIYQSVMSPHTEAAIMQRHAERMKSWGFPGDEWENAKQTYGVDGMPEPTVQITISSEAEAKMNYLRSYNKREREVIGFFIPEFEKYKPAAYFSLFDREFFRVIAF